MFEFIFILFYFSTPCSSIELFIPPYLMIEMCPSGPQGVVVHKLQYGWATSLSRSPVCVMFIWMSGLGCVWSQFDCKIAIRRMRVCFKVGFSWLVWVFLKSGWSWCNCFYTRYDLKWTNHEFMHSNQCGTNPTQGFHFGPVWCWVSGVP